MRWLICLLLLACGAATGGPPEIRYGEDECSRCRMIVGEERFAAAWGEQIFDDVGELFESATAPDEPVWVHDADTFGWLDGRKAFYVHCWGLKTPMGYGVLAVETRPQAEVLAARYRGRILSFDESRAEISGGK